MWCQQGMSGVIKMQAFKSVVPLEWASIGRSKGACMAALVCVALCFVHTLLHEKYKMFVCGGKYVIIDSLLIIYAFFKVSEVWSGIRECECLISVM